MNILIEPPLRSAAFTFNPQARVFAGSAVVYDTVLAESEHFVVVPSLGGFVPGWVLVLPRTEALCVAACPTAHWPELSDLVQRVSAHLINRFGAVATFEHGPRQRGSTTGCSVDYAHLHVVATTHLAPTVFAQSNSAEWRQGGFAEVRVAHLMGQSYLYFVDTDGVSRVNTKDGDFQSQFFRRALATANRYSGSPDWKANPCLENVAATIESFADF